MNLKFLFSEKSAGFGLEVSVDDIPSISIADWKTKGISLGRKRNLGFG